MPPERTSGGSGTKRKTTAFKPPTRTNSKPSSTGGKTSAAKASSARSVAVDVDDNDDADQEPAPVASQDQTPTIPAKLLTRLLHEHFEDDRTRISKDASQAMQKYMEVFVREALARAAFERQESGVSRRGDAFLEVEDLEKLAPQLLLDF
ncbi:hypothetical protein L228DRAFT_281156 [Xylona heveae TC161]|uniref:Centromere protein X n=1 Tax=Xylona heveae (strain CBS 132557 / TC161) TaxID=1328760 RepID=A0A165HX02_XYLHT|nr:hypothetical protein L228DRAFT_281156 [Xylona heveae TC161]KZF24043.1 hypothetical protein L228DRAFT_281156 [Xylona heveae TC161]